MKYYEGNHPMGNLGLLQAYRKNPFSLAVDMSRPEQLLPPGLPNFVYQPPQPIVQDPYAVGGGRGGMMYGDNFSGGYEGGDSSGAAGDAAAAAAAAAAADAGAAAAGGGGGGGAK